MAQLDILMLIGFPHFARDELVFNTKAKVSVKKLLDKSLKLKVQYKHRSLR